MKSHHVGSALFFNNQFSRQERRFMGIPFRRLHKRCIKGFIEFISSYLGMTNKNRSAMPGFFLSAVPLFDCEKPGIYHILFALATFQSEIRHALLATQCYVLRNDKSAENDTAESRYQKNQIVFQVLSILTLHCDRSKCPYQ